MTGREQKSEIPLRLMEQGKPDQSQLPNGKQKSNAAKMHNLLNLAWCFWPIREKSSSQAMPVQSSDLILNDWMLWWYSISAINVLIQPAAEIQLWTVQEFECRDVMEHWCQTSTPKENSGKVKKKSFWLKTWKRFWGNKDLQKRKKLCSTTARYGWLRVILCY